MNANIANDIANQPLVSPAPATDPITIEDLKHRAQEVGDLAASVSKRVAGKVAQQSATRKLLVVGGIVLLTASLAYLAGRHAMARMLNSDE